MVGDLSRVPTPHCGPDYLSPVPPMLHWLLVGWVSRTHALPTDRGWRLLGGDLGTAGGDGALDCPFALCHADHHLDGRVELDIGCSLTCIVLRSRKHIVSIRDPLHVVFFCWNKHLLKAQF